jgi:2-polyprenyl-3-methyl-5-hydroxy-6-metoxy-1,4-benzoquinol methylase
MIVVYRKNNVEGEIRMDKVAYIRQKEKEYHEQCYTENELFQVGSWLHKPVPFVLEVIREIPRSASLRALDLGCGVGRHSIPLAKKIGKKGNVVCVDLLPVALEKLMEYGKMYGVEERLTCIQAEIDDMKIEKGTYDYIVAISSLEHVRSEHLLRDVLERMKTGTRENGIHYLVVNSSLEETDVATGKQLDPLIEVNIETEIMLALLDERYTGWTSIKREVKNLQFTIERDGKEVFLKTNAITYVVQKS